MPPPSLILSNPPHGLVDAKRAGPLLGLLPVELTLKAHYPIPEVWLSRDDAAAADAAAAELRAAGCGVKVVPADALRDVPQQRLAEGLYFTDDGLALALDDEDIVLPYDLPIVIAACSPRDGGGEDAKARPLPDAEGWGAWGMFADLYAYTDGGWLRLGVSPAVTDFSSLDTSGVAGPAGKLSRFLSECETRLRRGVIDRRLMYLQVRRRQAALPAGVQRKGFAFGTAALGQLLESIDAGLSDASQCEISSRLVYLTQR
jgi:hypothetical protein